MESQDKKRSISSPPAPRQPLPIIPFQAGDYGRSIITFPHLIVPVEIVANSSLDKKIKQNGNIILGHIHEFRIIEGVLGRELMPYPYAYGVLGTVQRIRRMQDIVKLEIYLTSRIHMHTISLNEFFTADHWELLPEENPSPLEFHAPLFQQHIKTIKQAINSFGEVTIGDEKFVPQNLRKTDLTEDTLGAFIDQGMFIFNHFGVLDRIAKFLRSILMEPNVSRRMNLSVALFDDIRQQKISLADFLEESEFDGTKDEPDCQEKLRNKGGSVTVKQNGEYEKYNQWYERIKNRIPQNARDEIERELEQMQAERPPAEAKKHLIFLLKLFSLEETKDNTDLKSAKEILDKDHAGLQKIKERMLEYLAVRKYAQGNVNILCFVGPPGVGKTSLGASIARALGKKFERLSLGGLRDEAEIKGHGLTYTNTQPGWLIKKLIASGSKNPVLVLDEIDKVSKDWRGDPQAALFEALDPEQNKEFLDHSINVPFDFSKIFFICTANTVSTIPPALRDRMEILRISGYTPYEKLDITKRYLIPKIFQRSGVPFPRTGYPSLKTQITDEAILEIIEQYTNESGVRQLERCIENIVRKIAFRFEQNEFISIDSLTVTKTNLREYVGKPISYPEQRFEKLPPGCVPMFAVSEAGGYFFYVEVMLERGHEQRKIKVTGVRGSEIPHNINNVIEESVDVAFDSLMFEGGILHQTMPTREKEKEFHVHVHISDNAIPKDGPSAGIPILAGLYGRIQSKSIQPNLGATGEIDMVMGTIHPVGGIREKALAAYRAGIKRFIIPEDNIRDLDEIPEEIKKDIEFLPKRYTWDALLEMFPNDELILGYIEKRQSSQ